MSEQFKFRDVFNSVLVETLADNLINSWPPFDRQTFFNTITPQLDALSFGARSSLIADTLHSLLPESFPEAVKILIQALGPEPKEDSLSGFAGFIIMPQCLFVSRYGHGYPTESLNALYEMTKRFTAEGDIRPFIEKYPDQTMAFLHELTQDPSPFARRLPSEGTRPRLPLCSRLPIFQNDPTPVIALLDKLYTDPNLMVRRSVANNLNDIAKDNPDTVVATLVRWRKESPSVELEWIISHSCRTIVKQGHSGALSLQGYDPEVTISVSEIHLSHSQLPIGDELSFTFSVTSSEKYPSKLMIDYVIYFMKANGKQAFKVFKAAKKVLLPGQTIIIEKKHSFQQRNTRVHYTGIHSMEIQINGIKHTQADFILLPQERS